MRQTMYQTLEQDGAKKFLDSIGRNSTKSKITYAVALTHFQKFLDSKQHTLQSVLKPLQTNAINIYDLFDEFVTYMLEQKNGNDGSMSISNSTIKVYTAAIKSYLAYYDIDLVPAKFKRKVKMPKVYREDEEAVDAKDIREILLHCNNRRLKAFLLILASAGPRTIEGTSLRICDVDFTNSPTKINIRKEFTKTKRARYSFISDEATKCLKELLEWRYRERGKKSRTPIKNDTDLVFGSRKTPKWIYNKLRIEFNKILANVDKGTRKDGEQRRKITLNSLRRFVKSVVAEQASSDYSEWLIGHTKSSYWVKKELEKREIYKTKCMKYLTFLDYTVLEATGKNIETRLQEKDSEMQAMKTKYEQDMKAMREEMENKFQQILTKIDTGKLA
jgi:integrase